MGGRSAPAPCSQSNQLIKQTPKALTHDFPSSLVLSLPLKNRYPRGFSVYPAASKCSPSRAVPSISQILNLLDSR